MGDGAAPKTKDSSEWNAMRASLFEGFWRRKSSNRRRRESSAPLAAETLEARVCLDTVGLPVAINLAPVRASDREWAFVDVFRGHTPWVSQFPGKNSPWERPHDLKLDDDGNPLLAPHQAAGTRMLVGMEGHYPAGTYVVTYAGDGEIFFGMDAAVTSASDHRLELAVTPSDRGIYLRIDRSNPTDPIRDLHVWSPGFENAASSFHPKFLEGLKDVRALRFMDWQRTNNSELEHWSDRAKSSDSSQSTSAGVAVEIMVELANTLHVDPWFNMPHLADDNYVRNFARLVHEKLDPTLNVYVEWSNEAWNLQFDQGEWTREEAIRRFGSPREFAKVIADESLRDWNLWRTEFADAPERVVRVLAGQLGRPRLTERIAERLDGQFDAIAPAAYFSARGLTLDANTTAEDLLRAGMSDIENRLLPLLAAHKAIVDQWEAKSHRDLSFITYEGGQHFTAYGADVPWQQAMFDAQTDPGMYEAYRRLLVGAAALELDMFTAYSYVTANSKYGSWGQLQFQDQAASEAPKWRALLDAMSGNLWNDQEAPHAELGSTIDALVGLAGTRFKVRFSDDSGIDLDSLDDDDLQVKALGGKRLEVEFLSSRTTPQGVVEAVYRVSPPTKTWDRADLKSYSVFVAKGKVTDIYGNPIESRRLGMFQVGAGDAS